MALSATATVGGGTAAVQIACEAGATVTVRRKIEFAGFAGDAQPADGDVICLPGNVAGALVVQSHGGVTRNSGVTTLNVTKSLYWLRYAGQGLAAGSAVWRGAEDVAALSNSFSFFGGSFTNWMIGSPGRAIDWLDGDTVDKGLTVDAPGSLLVSSVYGAADSWTPPTSLILGTPVPASGVTWPAPPTLASMKGGGQAGQAGDPPGLVMSEAAGLWVREAALGPTGNWYGWIVESSPWDDGHTWFETVAYLLRPQTFPVTGSGTTRQATVTGLAPGENVILVSDGVETVTARITLAVNEPVNLGDGRWKLSGTRA